MFLFGIKKVYNKTYLENISFFYGVATRTPESERAFPEQVEGFLI